MSVRIREIMLKEGMPTVEEARRRLKEELEQARRHGDRVLKLIHGYGSTGVGGVLRDAIRSSLRRRCKEGKIRAFVAAERWDSLDKSVRTLLDTCPELARDADFRNHNEGVTFVLP
ncbi:MAG TPA: Smr/MutS family protein [Phycisphaerae bacterium]|nr:Smr/MutS family protein [Phycisphaerae bacterium]